MVPNKIDGREIGLIGGPLGRGRPKGGSKTKDSYDPFNLFILRCCYLIYKHSKPRSKSDLKFYSRIYRWICDFLKSNGYVKRNRSYYGENDIKRIAFKLEEKKNYPWKEDFHILFDLKYKRFKPQ